MRKDTIALLLSVLALALGCSGPSKLRTIETGRLGASLALSRSELAEERKVIALAHRDTLSVEGEDGGRILIMKAVKDDETGEMVATDVLDAAVVTARFRNVAERNGTVDLRFEVIVPEQMIDSKWQLRFYPDMFVLEDSVRLESVIITGEDYRKAQLRGYELYERYLSSIITDTTAFIDRRNLEIWISRNMVDLYRYRNDTSWVDVDAFHSYFGPTEAEALRHYTWWSRRRRHEARWHLRGRKFSQLVKSPILDKGVRLDTVLRDAAGNFVYQYTQSLRTRPRLRKVDIVLSGEIYEEDRRLYSMPRTEPLTFYISSLSSLVDGTERYLTRVIERRAEANTACYVDFAKGSSEIDLSLGHNREEMGRIRGNILELIGSDTFEMDSIVIAASASPEGGRRANELLSARRAAAVAGYYEDYIRHYRDSVQRSLEREAGFAITVDESGRERAARAPAPKADIPSIRFLSRSSGENWPYLKVLVEEDPALGEEDRRAFARALEIEDPDRREECLQGEPFYTHMRESLYPRLRTVRFDFHLHRRGMVKDTVHTTELDTAYMRGVQLIRDREYEKALSVLKGYRDYNTAVAYLALDYNASAMAILSELPRSPRVDYMMALLHARRGDDQKAVQYYMDACRRDRSLVFRGNLDPEIYILIQRYGLNREDEGTDGLD